MKGYVTFLSAILASHPLRDTQIPLLLVHGSVLVPTRLPGTKLLGSSPGKGMPR